LPARNDIVRTLRSWRADYPLSRLIVTSRPQHPLNIGASRTFRMLPLTNERIEEFLTLQLSGDAAEMLRQLQRQRLWPLASNTLLPTLLVLLFRRHRALPESRALLLSNVVETIKQIEEDKLRPMPAGDFEMLGVIAMLSIRTGTGYAVSRRDAAVVIEDRLRETLAAIGGRDAKLKLQAVFDGRFGEVRGTDAVWPLVHLRTLVTAEDEEWLLRALEERSDLDLPSRRWIYDLLGLVGSERAIPVLTAALQLEPELAESAFHGLQAVHRRLGRLWYKGEERLSV